MHSSEEVKQVGETKSPIPLRELTKRIYAKAKAEPRHRFWGLYVHVCKDETLREAYKLVKANNGAPGVDGVTFADVERRGVDGFLAEIEKELVEGSYRPQPNRSVEIPKDNGKTRRLGIPSIRDRVVQGALKIVLEPIFEADFSDLSFGFRPGRSQHDAIARVRHGINRGHTRVIDIDLSGYFDNVKHDKLIARVARRTCDPRVLRLLKLILRATGRQGVPQGGVISPLLSNVYLHDVDLVMEKAVETTGDGKYPNMTFTRYADDMVALVNTHPAYERTEWLVEALHKRFEEEFAKLDVTMNREKTRTVELHSGESFSFLGFDFRLVDRRNPSEGKKPWKLLQTPRLKKRTELIREVRDVVRYQGGVLPTKEVIARINAKVRGWVSYFRHSNAADAFRYVRLHVEKKVRRMLMRRRGKRGFGWKRWSREYVYGRLGLFDGYKVSYYVPKALPVRYAP